MEITTANKAENDLKHYAYEVFSIEKLHLLDTLDKMMKVIKLCDWIFNRHTIKAILLYINWSELSIRRSVQLIKRSQVNPEVLKDFIIFLNKTHDDEVIECIDYAVKIDFFCYPNSNRIYSLYESMFSKIAKENLLSHKLTMHLLIAFEGWETDFLEHSIRAIKWQNLSNKEWLAVYNKYSVLKNSSHPELLNLYNKERI